MCIPVRYIIYVVLTACVGYVSSLCPEEKDYLYGMGRNLLTVCITLVTLYTTISNLVMMQLSKFHEESKGNIKKCLESLRRNIRILMGLIATDAFVLIIIPNINIPLELWHWVLNHYRLITDMVVFFTLFYFLYVIYDSTLAFYNLFEHNNK